MFPCPKGSRNLKKHTRDSIKNQLEGFYAGMNRYGCSLALLQNIREPPLWASLCPI